MSHFTEIAAAPIPAARLALIADWHDMNEAGCCDDLGPFCPESKSWANGYLSAIADGEAAGCRHTCDGHPTDLCSACREAKAAVAGEHQ